MMPKLQTHVIAKVHENSTSSDHRTTENTTFTLTLPKMKNRVTDLAFKLFPIKIITSTK